MHHVIGMLRGMRWICVYCIDRTVCIFSSCSPAMIRHHKSVVTRVLCPNIQQHAPRQHDLTTFQQEGENRLEPGIKRSSTIMKPLQVSTPKPIPSISIPRNAISIIIIIIIITATFATSQPAHPHQRNKLTNSFIRPCASSLFVLPVAIEANISFFPCNSTIFSSKLSCMMNRLICTSLF